MKQVLNGSEIVLECLKEQGVDTVFGYPGGAILNIYDELYKQSGIDIILPRHEQALVHEADAYARTTGKVIKSITFLLLMSRELLMQQTVMPEQQEK